MPLLIDWLQRFLLVFQVLVLMVVGTSICFAQQVKPSGTFNKKSVKIGEPVAYTLVFRYPASMEVRFPDTLFNYKPFELLSKKHFNTRTDHAGMSIDSTIYTLATFQTDSILFFTLPAIVLRNGDTTAIAADSAAILIEKIIPAADAEQAKLISTTDYFVVDRGLNYPYIIAGLSGFLLLLTLTYWIFGGRIRKALRLQRLRRKFERFINEYLPYTERQLSPEAAEHALALWKSYLQGLQGIPYTTYTSKEIAAILPDKSLEQTLRQLDLAIYGNKIDAQTVAATVFLADFAREAYRLKIEEVRNA
ncbi:hypothetical protein [Rhodoflexus sp.]